MAGVCWKRLGPEPEQRFKLTRGYNAFAGAGACTSGSAHIRPAESANAESANAESANHAYGAGSSSRMRNQTRMRRRQLRRLIPKLIRQDKVILCNFLIIEWDT